MSSQARAESGSDVDRRRPADPLPLSQEARRLRRRGWLVRRMLLAADVVGLAVSFAIAQVLFGDTDAAIDRISRAREVLLFVLTLPGWIVVAKLYGLYDRDEERTGHSTVDEFVDVLHLVTVGAWFSLVGAWLLGWAKPDIAKLVAFWAFSVVAVTAGRALARALARRSASYVQNTVIVGADATGRLIATKLSRHPEYAMNVVGFVDGETRRDISDTGGAPWLGTPEELRGIVDALRVDRVVIAFPDAEERQTSEAMRSLRDLDVQLDVVPRLAERVGRRTGFHAVEGFPLLAVSAGKLPRTSRLIKRTIDLVGATLVLAVASPLFVVIAWRIRRDSPGPVFYKQTRLGLGMKQFSMLKFRTMNVQTDDAPHREYLASTVDAASAAENNGLYKLAREDAVTRVGRWLRKTSLDELPQLINVIRGEMSLVGPRPALPYEVENYAPHHFDRFLVLPGLTGLWQVTARAQSTFGEALDMDLAYVRDWSLGLDLLLLAKTPLQLFRLRTC